MVIDYVQADVSVLTLVARHLGGAGLPSPLLREIDQLEAEDCARVGLALLEPTFAQLTEATADRAALSFEDWLCLVVARDLDAACVTNDKRLRAACEEEGVPLLWGL